MTFEEWFKQTSDYSHIGPETEEAERAWNHQQAKIDHIREYIVSGLQVAPEDSEYWLALRDCLNELDGIVK